ncbi:MAG: 16S rRNA (cytosine(1402)-N(4))-methyltransferase RsmH [Clostridia bacterium]|nr:16S rRNA (cytosine(1402)-N(4))-methyltransferase RsmH [Clostridia bacterium]
MTEFSHIPIMLDDVIELLNPCRGGVFVDGTLGGGGHSEAILKRLPSGSKHFGIDRDNEALEAAGKRLLVFQDAFKSIKGNFFDMKSLLEAEGVTGVDGILMDLGVSSYQLDATERGFSYHHDAPLDMRMDTDVPFSAYDVVNGYTSEKLFIIIKNYGEERYASRIANAIVKARTTKPIKTTCELAEIIKSAMPAQARWEGTHPARRTFQAIRIEVNGELDGLSKAMEDAFSILNPNGVLAVITFHSLEDRIVKQAFKKLENPCTCDPKAPICTCGAVKEARILTKKPLVASDEENALNPRARSAKLRAIQRI